MQRTNWIGRAGLAAALLAFLVACGAPLATTNSTPQAGAATAVPTTAMTAPPTPTAIPLDPTAVAATPTNVAAATEHPATALEAVHQLLDAIQADNTLQTALPYLGGVLRDGAAQAQINGNQLLQQQMPFRSFTVNGYSARDGQRIFVHATLLYDGDNPGSERIFIVSPAEDEVWRIYRVTNPNDVPNTADWPGPGWQKFVEEDYNADGIAETIYIAPSLIQPSDTFRDDYLRSHAVVAQEIMVVQPGA